MKTARAHLNWVIDEPDMPANMKTDARAALNAIEEHPLLVGALRNVLLYPKNAESIAHATRVLEQVDNAAARLAALAAPKEEQFSDLV